MNKISPRLYWRCHRGMRELDLLLGYILDNLYPSFSKQQQGHFEDLIASSDMDILSWMTGTESPKQNDLAEFVAAIRIRISHLHETLGRAPEASKYSADMSKHYALGNDASLRRENQAFQKSL